MCTGDCLKLVHSVNFSKSVHPVDALKLVCSVNFNKIICPVNYDKPVHPGNFNSTCPVDVCKPIPSLNSYTLLILINL